MSIPPPGLVLPALVTGLLMMTGTAAAQGAQRVTGTVRNEAGRPMEDALVLLDPDASPRRTNTDSAGAFRFDRVSPGSHVLRVLQVGYTPHEQTIEVGGSDVMIGVVLRRLPYALDTLRVFASRTAIVGTVVARESFRAVNRATVRLQGTRLVRTTGPDGRFEFTDLREGAYVLYAAAPTLLPRIMSVFVPGDSAVEIALLMDGMSAPGARALAAPLAEFDTRVRFARAHSALVPRQELAGHEKRGVGHALRYSLSFMRTGMILDETQVCVFVNGLPKPGAIPNDYKVEDVESVEVYGFGSEKTTSTLDRRWPGFGLTGSGAASFPCGNRELGGLDQYPRPRTRYGSGAVIGVLRQPYARPVQDYIVRTVVIWLKR